MGWRKANWLGLTWTLIAFQSITNAFTCFYRADFLTTLVNVLAIFFLNDLDGLDRDHFRLLPLLQLLSIGYDTTWLFILQDLNNESVQENGLESSVKRFSLSLSYVQYGFKVSIRLTNQLCSFASIKYMGISRLTSALSNIYDVSVRNIFSNHEIFLKLKAAGIPCLPFDYTCSFLILTVFLLVFDTTGSLESFVQLPG